MLRDADIREPLFDFLELSFGKIRILEEKVIGKARADVVMITEDALWGIEIKSDADTYARLAKQVKEYDKYYDYNVVVIGTSHALHIFEHIPKYWGVVTVEEIEGKADFYFYKKPEINPKMKIEKKLSLMWRPELARLQEINGMPKYKAESKDFVIKKIAERVKYEEGKKGKISLENLTRQMCEELFERDYTTIEKEIKEYKKKK